MPNGWGACISFSVYRSDWIWRRWTRSANSRRLRRILPTARIMSLALIICVTIWCMKRARVGRGLHFAIVDEVDSILIDEARTPLIISGQAEDHTDLYVKMNALPPLLKRQIGEEK